MTLGVLHFFRLASNPYKENGLPEYTKVSNSVHCGSRKLARNKMLHTYVMFICTVKVIVEFLITEIHSNRCPWKLLSFDPSEYIGNLRKHKPLYIHLYRWCHEKSHMCHLTFLVMRSDSSGRISFIICPIMLWLLESLAHQHTWHSKCHIGLSWCPIRQNVNHTCCVSIEKLSNCIFVIFLNNSACKGAIFSTLHCVPLIW